VAVPGHTLFDLDVLVEASRRRREVPLTFNSFWAMLQEEGLEPAPPHGVPQKLPPLPAGAEFGAEPCIGEGASPMSVDAGPRRPPGGERAGLARMEVVLANERWVCDFERPLTAPMSLEPATPQLSPYFSYGCLSARYYWARLHEVERNCRDRGWKPKAPPRSLRSALIWREMAHFAGYVVEGFDRQVGSGVSLPDVDWGEDAEVGRWLELWEAGATGIPTVDALMRQLSHTGWMHHIARHFVACFLTRGGCWVHWERGEEAFQRRLVDYDWSINAANWLWLAGLFFFFTFHRVYNPVAFGRKHDRNGEFVRHWVPELRGLPDRFLHQPWDAPPEVQRQAGCVIGQDYPGPIFTNFEERAKKNLKRVEAAYLAAPPEFLVWIPPHALRELERDSPDFARQLLSHQRAAVTSRGRKPALATLRCDKLGVHKPARQDLQALLARVAAGGVPQALGTLGMTLPAAVESEERFSRTDVGAPDFRKSGIAFGSMRPARSRWDTSLRQTGSPEAGKTRPPGTPSACRRWRCAPSSVNTPHDAACGG